MFHPNSWWWDWNWPRFLRVIVTPFGTQVVSIWNKRGVLLSDILNICRGLLFGCCTGKAFFFFSFSFLIWPAFIFTESHRSQLKGRKKPTLSTAGAGAHALWGWSPGGCTRSLHGRRPADMAWARPSGLCCWPHTAAREMSPSESHSAAQTAHH